MRKQLYKIWEAASLLLAAAAVAGGTFALLTAPASPSDGDQRRLEQELRENTALLEQQADSGDAVMSDPSGKRGDETEAPASAKNAPQKGEGLAITAIGDSVMLGAVPELQRAFPECVIDAEESRQVWDAVSVARNLEERGELRDIVVVALGGNGSFDKSSGQELIDALGPGRSVFWIAPFGKYLTWQESADRTLGELEEDNENLTVLDWPETAAAHTDWFYDDGMHLNGEGQEGYAAFLLERLRESVPAGGEET